MKTSIPSNICLHAAVTYFLSNGKLVLSQ